MKKVIVKGAGDLATGVASVLYRAGFQVVMTDIEKPTVIRRTVAFAEAIYNGTAEVEGIIAEKTDQDGLEDVLKRERIPVLIDPEAKIIKAWQPDVVVDAILAKRNLGTKIDDAKIVIGLGPGFEAGNDVDLVVETMRGHDLGRLYYQGKAIPNTNTPGEIGGKSVTRVLRAPKAGVFQGKVPIGAVVSEGDLIAEVDGEYILAPFYGVVRGLLHDGLEVFTGMKVGDVDPRPVVEHCFTISDKARSLGGAVLCGILSLESGRK